MGPAHELAYRFGPFRYDPAQRLLFREGDPVPLAPKALDVLAVLVEHRGEAVSKEALIQAVWPDCVVEEIGLARNISALRKALGDDGERYIETIPKRGYRLIADPASSGAPRQARPAGVRAAWWAAAVLAAGALVYWQFYRPSRFVPRLRGAAAVAVVPFTAVNADTDMRNLAYVLDETLVVELSKHGGMQVMSPSTIQRYRRLGVPIALMARMLRLDVVVEASAETAGEQADVSIRLVDVHSGRLIWAETYDVGSPTAAGVRAAVAVPAANAITERLSAR